MKRKPAKREQIPLMTRVKSGQIQRIGWWDKFEGGIDLWIEFKNGDVYKYKNVPRELGQLFLDGNEINKGARSSGLKISLGRLFHYTIKIHPKLYPFKKVKI